MKLVASFLRVYNACYAGVYVKTPKVERATLATRLSGAGKVDGWDNNRGLDLTGKLESTDCVSEGVAVGVRGKDQLASAIVGLLMDASRLSSNKQRFIEQHSYRIDGEAT